MLHQVNHGDLGIVQHCHAGIDHLGQVMGRNIGGHTHSDTGRAVHQQIGETAGQNTGFFPAFVEVGIPVDGVLVDVTEHFVRKLGHSGLGITVSRSRVTVHRTEVTVAVHQHIAHGEILSQTHHGIIDRAVAMGVVLTKHITDAGCGLLEGLVGSQTGFVHGVQNSAVNRL